MLVLHVFYNSRSVDDQKAAGSSSKDVGAESCWARRDAQTLISDASALVLLVVSFSTES